MVIGYSDLTPASFTSNILVPACALLKKCVIDAVAHVTRRGNVGVHVDIWDEKAPLHQRVSHRSVIGRAAIDCLEGDCSTC